MFEVGQKVRIKERVLYWAGLEGTVVNAMTDRYVISFKDRDLSLAFFHYEVENV